LNQSGDGSKRPFGPYQEENDNSWLGVSLNVHEDRLITCGSRWTRGGKLFMNGICFWLPDDQANGGRSFLGDLNSLIRPSSYDHRLIPLFVPGNTNHSMQPA